MTQSRPYLREEEEGFQGIKLRIGLPGDKHSPRWGELYLGKKMRGGCGRKQRK